ncbi:MAG TPA: preprotein translocase subunit SecG [Stellaceae bacterium]|nr:preprotein translocase subunit SecG [Stellaceae bacterium]
MFVIQALVAFALIGVVLLQKSDGGALGSIGGGGGMSGFMTGRSTANLLTRTTAILAAAFFAISILLVVLSNRTGAPTSILDQGPAMNTSPFPAAAPAKSSPATPMKPAAPSAPSAPLAH